MSELVVLAAGGPRELWPPLDELVSEKIRWIGVDRGAWYLLEDGVDLDLAAGDFDSLSEEERLHLFGEAVEVIQVPSEKDVTDTELALELAMDRYPQAQKYLLIGGTGGRLDHLLANFFVVFQPRFQPIIERLEIRDEHNSICFFLPGSHELQKEKRKSYVTFLCLTPVYDLTLVGFKYPLSQVEVQVPTSFTSNEFLALEARCEFSSGLVAMIQSSDR